MPHFRTIKYDLVPEPVTIQLWDQSEMAAAMGITEKHLIDLITTGGSGVVYHFTEPTWPAEYCQCGRETLSRKKPVYRFYFQDLAFNNNVKLAAINGWIEPAQAPRKEAEE